MSAGRWGLAAALVWGLGSGCGGGGTADERLAASADGRCGALDGSAAAVPCWTGQALERAGDGDTAGALAACAAIVPALWRDECHFQAAERLGLAGAVAGAVQACAAAGRFTDFCGLHLAWWARPFPLSVRPGDPAAPAAVDAELARMAALAPDGPTAALLAASVWFDLYYGSGDADPAAAQAADSPLARTAWAHEAVRLGGDRGAWSAPIEGTPLAPRCWRGLVVDPVPDPPGLAQVPLVHGGTRLVGQTPEEDREIALIEARFFHSGQRPALVELDALRALLLDPRPALRGTAARVLARSRGAGDPLVQVLLRGAPATAADLRAVLSTPPVDWAADPRCHGEDDE